MPTENAEAMVRWMRIAAFFAIGLAAAPALALRRSSSVPPPAGDPYRGRPIAEHAVRDTWRGKLVILGGVCHLALVPAGLVAALASAFAFSARDSNVAGALLFLSVSLGGLFVGPALLVAGYRIGRGRPTTRITALALAVFEAMLIGSATWATRPEHAVAIGAAAFVVLAAIPIAVLLPDGKAADPALARTRAALSALTVAAFLAIGAAAAAWIGDELGDRLSNHRSPQDDAWYVAVRPTTFGLAAALATGCMADLAIAFVGLRAARTPE